MNTHRISDRVPPRLQLKAREWLGLAIVLAGALVLGAQFWQYVTARPVVSFSEDDCTN